MESFFSSFDKVKGTYKLSDPEIFSNRNLSDLINFNMSDDEVKPIIRKKIDESITSAFEVLRKRIDKFGVTQPNIQRLGKTGRILVELPGAKDVERVKNLLQSTAQLEFWETFKNDQFFNFLSQANLLLRDKLKGDKNKADENQSDESGIDDLLSDVKQLDSLSSDNTNPINDLIKGLGFQGGPVLAQVSKKDKDLFKYYLDLPEVRRLLPSNLRYVKFMWVRQIKIMIWLIYL